MSCIHSVCNCYCTLHQKVCNKPCSPRCKDYCNEQTAVELKKELNKGPATNTNCACGANNSTAENDYISMLERFINNCYPSENFGLFNLTPQQAETHVDNNMRYLGYNRQMVDRAYYGTIVHFADSKYGSCYVRLNNFIDGLLKQPHKDYENNYSNNFRFVLTLILGYLDKLDSIAIIDCDDPRSYFKDKVSEVLVPDLKDAVNKTRLYVKASNDNNLAKGMRMVEQWFEEIAKENIPPKEVTIADIEKQLGYKIKIVGEEK